MVSSSEQRRKRYRKKLNAAVIGGRYDKTKGMSVQQEKKYFKEAVEVEEKVKTILSDASTTEISYYIIFAKEILKVMRKHTGETARMEICCLCRKWWMRGLQAINLNKVALLYAGMACFDIKECDYPAEGDVKAGVVYDYGSSTGTFECEVCDYPIESNVLDGIVYANGEMTGTFESPPEMGLPWTGQVTSYLAGDDGYYQKGYTLARPIPTGRFTDNGDGTITDNATGLMWEQNGIYKATGWANAIAYAEALELGGKTDWRLPNLKELMSIADYSKGNPCINSVFLPTAVYDYWSSTTHWSNANYAWFVYFNEGSITNISKTYSGLYVRSVRGGQP